MTGQQKDGGRKAFLGFIKNKKQEKWLLLLLVGILLLVISFPTKQKTADESGGIISETETDYEVYERTTGAAGGAAPRFHGRNRKG